MIRNLKTLLLAAMALAAFGAMAATGAHAAEEKFHCTVEPCRVTVKADGTGTTAHQVLVISDTSGHSASFTCAGLTGEATSATKTTEELNVENINYIEPCTVSGSGSVHIRTNGCKFKWRFFHGGIGAELHFECPGAKHVEIEIRNPITGNTLCTFEVTPFTLLAGIRFKTIGSAPSREVTSEVNATEIPVEAKTGDTLANCGVDPSQTLSAKYTTGNTLATGETSAGVMADAWFE